MNAIYQVATVVQGNRNDIGTQEDTSLLPTEEAAMI